MFPEHKVYVEPFLGGGAVFWEKEPSPKEVINDLDSKLVADYRRILTAPTNPSAYPILTTESAQNAHLRKSHTRKADQVVESLLRRCNGFGGTYIEKGTSDRKGRVHKVTTHEDKLQTIADYKKRLRHATLTNESYDTTFRKHDGTDTFFFLDPPYEKSVGLDYAEGSEAFNFAKFAEDVRSLKGKFLLTINNSPAIRKLFKGLKLYPYVVKGHHSKSAIGKEDRKELLITNYDLPRNWKNRMTKGVLSGGAYFCDEELTGGARGVKDPLALFKQASREAREFYSKGGGCAVFGLFALREYLNFPIDLRKVKPLVRLNERGALDVGFIRGALTDDMEVEEVSENNGENLLSDDAVHAHLERMREDGGAMLMIIYEHLMAVLPMKQDDGTYMPVLFDCEVGGPALLPPGTTRNDVYWLFYINAEPRKLKGGAKEGCCAAFAIDRLNDVGYELESLRDLVEKEDGATTQEIRDAFRAKGVTVVEHGNPDVVSKKLPDPMDTFQTKDVDFLVYTYNPDNKEKHVSAVLRDEEGDLIWQEEDKVNEEDKEEEFTMDLTQSWRRQEVVDVLGRGTYITAIWELTRPVRGGTHKKQVLKKLGLKDTGHSVDDLAKASGISASVLQEVYNRGIGAYKTNPQSVRMKGTFEKNVDAPLSQKLSKEQWAMARLYSFLNENPKHDQDLRGGAKYTNYLDEARGELPALYVERRGIELTLANLDKFPAFARPNKGEEEAKLKEINSLIESYEAALMAIGEKPSRAVADWGDANWTSKLKYLLKNPPKFWGQGKKDPFEHQLATLGYSPMTYIRDVRRKAKAAGYDPDMIGFAEDGTHKVKIQTPTGKTVSFGRVGYGDFLLWTHLEKRGEAPKGVAKTKRRVFHASHKALPGRWKADRFSPNNLALALLW